MKHNFKKSLKINLVKYNLRTHGTQSTGWSEVIIIALVKWNNLIISLFLKIDSSMTWKLWKLLSMYIHGKLFVFFFFLIRIPDKFHIADRCYEFTFEKRSQKCSPKQFQKVEFNTRLLHRTLIYFVVLTVIILMVEIVY